MNSKSHPFIAGIADFYFCSLVLSSAIAFAIAATGFEPQMPLLLSMLGLSLGASIAYHTAISRRLKWLSPGELVAGRQLRAESKEWWNPYLRNRWALFFVQLLTLSLAGNAFDAVFDGTISVTVPKVTATVLWIVLKCYGIVRVGQGDLKGGTYVVVAFIVQALGTAASSDMPPELVSASIAIYGFFIVLNVAVFLSYAFLRRRSPSAAEIIS